MSKLRNVSLKWIIIRCEYKVKFLLQKQENNDQSLFLRIDQIIERLRKEEVVKWSNEKIIVMLGIGNL